MSTYDLVHELCDLSKERSKIYNGGKVCQSFALGWFMGEMQANLDEMGLSKKQLKVLESRIARLKRMSEEDK